MEPTDKELLDWIQASPNPRLKLVYDEWLNANSISFRSAILTVMQRTEPNTFSAKSGEQKN